MKTQKRKGKNRFPRIFRDVRSNFIPVLEADPVEIIDIRNDEATISWALPPDVANQTDKQRLMIAVIRSGFSAYVITDTLEAVFNQEFLTIGLL